MKADTIHVYRSYDGTDTFRCSIRNINLLTSCTKLESSRGAMVLMDDDSITATAILRPNYRSVQFAVKAAKNYCRKVGITEVKELWFYSPNSVGSQIQANPLTGETPHKHKKT